MVYNLWAPISTTVWPKFLEVMLIGAFIKITYFFQVVLIRPEYFQLKIWGLNFGKFLKINASQFRKMALLNASSLLVFHAAATRSTQFAPNIVAEPMRQVAINTYSKQWSWYGFQNIFKKFQKRSNKISKKFQKNSKKFPKNFQKISKKFQKNFQNISKKFPKYFQKNFKNLIFNWNFLILKFNLKVKKIVQYQS